MSTLSFNILPSTTSNDHEVRIVVDGKDVLGEDYLGLDPPRFFNQETLYKPGELTIGRCACGCEGCSDYPVKVHLDQDKIIWTDHNGLQWEFEFAAYKKIILEAKNDYSWEDENRKAERLISNLFQHKKTRDGYIFNWASTRIKKHLITLSFSKNGEQKLLEFPRDKTSLNNTLLQAQKFANNI